MEDVRIILSASWVALTLTYLLGDVLRIHSGDFKAGEIAGMKMTQNRWLGVAVLMVTPIIMVFLSLTLTYPVIRWANIIVTIAFFWFQSHWVALIPFLLRQILDNCRTCVQCADFLVCMDMGLSKNCRTSPRS